MNEDNSRGETLKKQGNCIPGGRKLKEIRRAISQYKKCTQADLAEMIGTTIDMVGKMEVGIGSVSANMRRKIYEATGAEILDEYEWPVYRIHKNGASGFIYVRFKLLHYLNHKHEGRAYCHCCGQKLK